MRYVDGFVIPLARKNLAAYRRMADIGRKLWMKHGALDYVESVGDDLNPKMDGMKFLKFPQMVKTKPGETVIFSFIVFKSRAHRDSVNAKVMKEFMNDSKDKDKQMPFEM